MNYTRQDAYAARVPARAAATDALWVTYRWMTLGLATTGLVALWVAHSQAAIELLLTNRLAFYGLIVAQLGLVWTFNGVAQRASTAATALMFFAYAAITGVTFGLLFLVYTAQSIASTFFVTAGSFAGLSLFGATTKRDLSPIGRFAVFAVIGLIVAMVVNMFVASSGFSLLISVIGVVVFAALTAYDTQKLKAMFESGEAHANLPLVGALVLYLDFVNLFLFLLRFADRRR